MGEGHFASLFIFRIKIGQKKFGCGALHNGTFTEGLLKGSLRSRKEAEDTAISSPKRRFSFGFASGGPPAAPPGGD